jgi:signal transduction histidine kinase
VRSHHFGIVGMFEWASLVNGEFSIKSREEGGTVVSLIIPFDDELFHALEEVSAYGQ